VLPAAVVPGTGVVFVVSRIAMPRMCRAGSCSPTPVTTGTFTASPTSGSVTDATAHFGSSGTANA